MAEAEDISDTMVAMSVHCGEVEFTALEDVVGALHTISASGSGSGSGSSTDLAERCKVLAARYLDQIQNLSGVQRMLLKRVTRLDGEAACAVALLVFRGMHRAPYRYAKRARPCRKWRRSSRPY
jgi:hypothetical protein